VAVTAMMIREAKTWGLEQVWFIRCYLREIYRRVNFLAWFIALEIVLLAITLFATWQYQIASEKYQHNQVQRSVISNRANRIRTLVDPSVEQNRKNLEGFHTVLTSGHDLFDLLNSLIVDAKDRDLLSNGMDYQFEDDAGEKNYFRVKITTPLRGDVDSVYSYVTASMAKHPALAIDQMNLKRERKDIRVVEAKIIWTLFLRNDEENTFPFRTEKGAK
jgi:hypothetical protein